MSDLSYNIRPQKVITAKLYRATSDTAANEYTGAYEVTPKTAAQTLETKNKRMKDNVSVLAIPYYEVGNASDGETAIIGDDLNYGN